MTDDEIDVTEQTFRKKMYATVNHDVCFHVLLHVPQGMRFRDWSSLNRINFRLVSNLSFRPYIANAKAFTIAILEKLCAGQTD